MKFTKEVRPGNVVVWKRTERPQPDEEVVKTLCKRSPAEARVLPTEEKRLWFYTKIEQVKKQFEGSKTMILIERGNFLRDSFEQFRTTSDLDLRGELKIHFIDESAQDAGGLIREWFSIIVEELLNPAFGLFRRANVSELSYAINPDAAKFHDNYLEYYYFAGQVFGKAVYERNPIKGYLNRVLMKQILGQKVTLDDFGSYDQELWKSLTFIVKNELKEGHELGVTFTVQKKDSLVELKKGGKEILVNEGNKEEFCRLFLEYYLVRSVQSQLESFLRGFYSLIHKDMVSILDVDEFEFFMCGDPRIDLEDWRRNTAYKEFYGPEHQVIRWFWEVMGELTEDERRLFLQFCTGSSRVPAEGFKGLLSNSGRVCSFCVGPRDYSGPDTAFVVAHTCFNRIELPNYPEKDIMLRNMKQMLSDPQCARFALE